MKQEKLVRKFLPVEPFDMRGLEEWLSSMAARGLHLAKINQDRACFRPGPPQDGVRYALDITGPMDIDRERNENYAQMGWDYTATLPGLYYVYRSQDPDAPALHTDPVTQSWTLNRLLRTRPWALLLGGLLLLVLYRNSLATLIADPWSPIRFLLLKTENALLLLATTVSCLLVGLVPLLRRRQALRALQKQLAAGIPLDESRRWPRRVPSIAVNCGFWAMLAGIIALVLWLEPRAVQELSGPDQWNFPYVTLEQALSGTETDRLIPDTPYDPRLHPDTLRGSLLTPEQIAWSQWGTAILTGGGRAECGISIHIYRLRLENTAPLLLRCLQSEQRAYWRWYQKNSGELYMNPVLSEFQDFQPLDRPAFDALSVLSWRTADMDVPRQFYAGQAGNMVFTLTCWGPADASLAMELFHEIIAVQ